eukprot:scaffold211720_cov33-Prasinocladus_malaysianus.AAC.1
MSAWLGVGIPEAPALVQKRLDPGAVQRLVGRPCPHVDLVATRRGLVEPVHHVVCIDVAPPFLQYEVCPPEWSQWTQSCITHPRNPN